MQKPITNVWRVIGKTCLVLLIINFAFPLLSFLHFPSVSLYNHLYPGRQRLPFGENPSLSYNLTLNDIDAMLASHVVANSDPGAGYSIFVIGDSSIWGTLLENRDTVPAQLQNAVNAGKQTNAPVRVYNLGYPTSSVLKDLVLLDEAMQYQPDMVIWFVTLNSLIKNSYQEAPIVLNNPEKTNAVIERYGLDTELLPERTYWEKTFLEQRRDIYDRIRLQVLGSMWAATRIDQYIPEEYTPAARDLEADDSYQYLEGHTLSENDLDLSVITSFIAQNPSVRVIVVNEPILISSGANSDLRYDLYYPRWTYDTYRALISAKFEEIEIQYIDLWDVVPETLFTNSAIHYDAQGVDIVTEKLYSFIMKDIEEP
jgi:hypothetical protein